MINMEVEYIAKDSRELKKLEEIIKGLPCILIPNSFAVQVKSAGLEGTAVHITPKYNRTSIDEIRGNPERAGFMKLDYNSDSPKLIVKNKDYTYFIHLKRSEE